MTRKKAESGIWSTCNICTCYRGCGTIEITVSYAATLKVFVCAGCAQNVLDQIPKSERDRQTEKPKKRH